ncbi:DUF58 domain-containing protein [bacterium]|jgi:uncharacterized protein (DUF58 family)|nr:DUF58 domain-containing protein [bacterium]MBT5734657.1 DUF58 domain-containing protein [bacterium]MBT6018448.1 DUF58 domain-containing protein [bacterium]MBT6777360.1 DUF58 domain-containing protein [bacterium]
MVAMLNSISMKAKLVVEGYIIGQHRSPYHGFSVEFSEHRSYEPGDEVKHIDWKLYGKTNRLYVKRYEEETNLRAHLILDTSKSMSYTSNKVSKLDYGSYLLAALSYLMISQQDAAGVVLFDEKIRSFIPPKSTPSHLNTLLNVLDAPKPGNDTKIESVLHQMAERINKRGLVIIISDLLDEPKNILKGLKHFRHKKQEVILFHILDRNELEFEFENRTKFVDMESGEEITTDPWHIKNDYKNLILDIQKYYSRNCRLNKIDYVPLYTDDSLDKGLSEYFNKRQRLG